jgi:hypothetical protein
MKRLISIPFMLIMIFLAFSIILLKSEPLMAASRTASRTVRSEEGRSSPYVEIVYKNDSDNMADRRKVFVFADSSGKLHRLYFDDSEENRWRGNCLGEEIFEKGRMIFDNYKEND